MKWERKCENIPIHIRKIEREILFNLNPDVPSHPEFYLAPLLHVRTESRFHAIRHFNIQIPHIHNLSLPKPNNQHA